MSGGKPVIKYNKNNKYECSNNQAPFIMDTRTIFEVIIEDNFLLHIVIA